MGFPVEAATGGSTSEGEHGSDNNNISNTTAFTAATTTMKPPAIVASSSWPCANCHTTVSSERCPTCQGIQVRIARESLQTQAFLMERLSPALFARRTSTPLSFSDQQQQQHEGWEADHEFRPLDPVACILASAPSPILTNEKQKLTLHSLKEIEDELKFRRNKRPLGMVEKSSTTSTTSPSTAASSLLPPKKTKWLSAV